MKRSNKLSALCTVLLCFLFPPRALQGDGKMRDPGNEVNVAVFAQLC